MVRVAVVVAVVVMLSIVVLIRVLSAVVGMLVIVVLIQLTFASVVGLSIVVLGNVVAAVFVSVSVVVLCAGVAVVVGLSVVVLGNVTSAVVVMLSVVVLGIVFAVVVVSAVVSLIMLLGAPRRANAAARLRFRAWAGRVGSVARLCVVARAVCRPKLYSCAAPLVSSPGLHRGVESVRGRAKCARRGNGLAAVFLYLGRLANGSWRVRSP